MKVNVFRDLLLFLVLFPLNQVSGQKDSTASKGKEPDFINDKFKEKKTMFFIAGKTGFENIQGSFSGTLGIYTAYEFKVSKKNVIGAGFGFFFQFDEDKGLQDKLFQFDIRYKYLYNLDHRMSHGKTGNNFSADYFLLSPCLTIKRDPYYLSGYYWNFTEGYWEAHYKREVLFDPRLKIGYGIQRLFLKRINLDINAGIQVGRFTYPPSWQDLLFGQITIGFIIK